LRRRGSGRRGGEQRDVNLGCARERGAFSDGLLGFFVLIHQHAERAHRGETQHGGLDDDEHGEVLLFHTLLILAQGTRRVNLSYATWNAAGERGRGGAGESQVAQRVDTPENRRYTDERLSDDAESFRISIGPYPILYHVDDSAQCIRVIAIREQVVNE